MKLVFTYCFILLATLSFSQGFISKAEKDTLTLEIKEMFDNYHKDIINGGLGNEFKYLDDSSDFFWVPPGHNSALDNNTIKRILKKNASIIDVIELSWETLNIYPLTQNVANYTGIVKCVQVGRDKSPITFKLIESGTLVKRDDGWKFLNGQSRGVTKE